MQQVEKEMEAGHMLDALIAKEVFGWQNIKLGNGGYMGIAPDAPTDDSWSYAQRYSTDLKAAWLVVEKLQPRFYVALSTFWLKGGHLGGVQGWRCCISAFNHEWREVGEGDTPMLAICRAALKAVSQS